MSNNLLSIGVSTERGLKFWFDGDRCHVYSSGNGLQDVTIQSLFASSQPKVDTVRWHERLKHGNYEALKSLIKTGMTNVTNSNIPERVCNGYALGKMTRQSKAYGN
uniref:GAG-pre-integrase domain-containing protein n=1 Tax=Spongospora subterranea TaxID=70186 RepID=A0A0H5RGY7_9EUKA|eukprot:CRZ13001.1 hypothetical protein [Spongospora subterranea]